MPLNKGKSWAPLTPKSKEMKDILDEYFHCETESEDEDALKEHDRYLEKRRERELEKQAQEFQRKKEAAAAREKAKAEELNDENDAWEWDGEARMSRLLDKCPSTGEHVWNGRYTQLMPGGKWVEGVLEKCSETGMYIWAGKGPRLLEQQPRPIPLAGDYVPRITLNTLRRVTRA
ncbi:hypothetical protein BDP27DRAFT_1433375 [Rhodocollybia butyracea]|uniref:Uncharacterized protein n=1 Tax=Rhodocollybia butyracea TaxID=206335 RepID=A0A9P5P3N9_9AGAR|nr:hypothetical protein BDP27DRAFT_1433375 [Rhodocollybia butyracea]